jgi:uncharacterized membrane protein YuzA (DUF378 family)
LKILHVITFSLVLIGALNWGLVGAFNYNLVESILGTSIAEIVYCLVGVSALYVAATHKKDCKMCGKPSMPGSSMSGM